MSNAADLFQKSLLRRLEDRGISQKDLAVLSGVPQATVSRYANGKSEPGICHASDIAAAFGMTLDEFLGERPTPPVAQPVRPALPEGIREAIRDELGGTLPAPIRALLPRLAALNDEDVREVAHQLTLMLDAFADADAADAAKSRLKQSKR